MKSGIIFYVFVLFFLMPAIAEGQYHFEIKGHINNISNNKSKNDIHSGDIMVLKFINLKRFDTAIVNDSGFVMQGEVPYPSIAMLEYKHGGDLFLLDNSSYSYYLNLKLLDSTHREYESTIKTNSPFYTTWDNFQNKKIDLYKEKGVLLNRLEKLKDPDSLLYINTAVKEIDNEISKAYKKLAIDNANMYATVYIVPASPGFSYADYVDIYNSLPDSIKNTFYGKNFHDKLMTSKQVEEKDPGATISLGAVPAIVGVDTSLNRIVISKKYYAKNRYTLVEFWASWCSPCRVVNQELRQRMSAFKNANIQIVCFSLDNVSEPWKTAVKKDKTGGLQISDLKATESPIVKFLNMTSIPQNILVDSNGEIVKKNIYAKDIDAFLETLKSKHENISK